MFLEISQNSQKNTCVRVCNFIKKEAVAQVFSKNTCFTEHLWVTASQLYLTLSWRRPISYRTQSIDLLRKSMDWFLYDIRLRHERVKRKLFFRKCLTETPRFCIFVSIYTSRSILCLIYVTYFSIIIFIVTRIYRNRQSSVSGCSLTFASFFSNSLWCCL